MNDPTFLNDILKKAGLDYSDLTREEKETFLRYKEAIVPDPMTIDKILDFIDSDLKRIEAEICKWDNTSVKDLFYKACWRNLKTLKAFITYPEAKRNLSLQEIQKNLNIKITTEESTVEEEEKPKRKSKKK